MTTRIGIVGCGAIGKAILKAADAGQINVDVAGVSARTEAPAQEFLASLHHDWPLVSQSDLIAASDLIIEAAGGHVVPELAAAVFDAGKDLMLISIGALVAHPEVMARSRETGCRLLMPSGAIIGLDGIKSASVGKIDHVTMVSRKGPDRTILKVIAVPGLQRNCHDIEVEGEFGLMRLHLENIPSENPKTGKLTAMSIIRTVQQAVDPVHLGT
jgi:aspartate dehydrogenase